MKKRRKKEKITEEGFAFKTIEGFLAGYTRPLGLGFVVLSNSEEGAIQKASEYYFCRNVEGKAVRVRVTVEEV